MVSVRARACVLCRWCAARWACPRPRCACGGPTASHGWPLASAPAPWMRRTRCATAPLGVGGAWVWGGGCLGGVRGGTWVGEVGWCPPCLIEILRFFFNALPLPHPPSHTSVHSLQGQQGQWLAAPCSRPPCQAPPLLFSHHSCQLSLVPRSSPCMPGLLHHFCCQLTLSSPLRMPAGRRLPAPSPFLSALLPASSPWPPPVACRPSTPSLVEVQGPLLHSPTTPAS